MIYLTGFMGSGKTTVGRVLAERLGLPFVDLDQQIEIRAGKTISAIFSAAGEETFRILEQRVLNDVAAGQEAVVATGGGLPVNARNRRVMKASGWIVHLEAGVETLGGRVGSGEGRPLWSADVYRLLSSRKNAYADADHALAVDELTPEQAADEIAAWYGERSAPVPVLVERDPYPVYVADGVFARLTELVGRHGAYEGFFVLVDENVRRLHGDALQEALGDMNHRLMTVPSGEESKSFAFLGRVLDEMLGAGLNRSWAVLAVGGGVTGDLAGCAASVFMRGIPVVQVPTTLLAQVDASIGGKTAVNHPRGKNLVGTFHQPLCVIADPELLSTLDEREYRAAMGEVLKYGFIGDAELLAHLEDRERPDGLWLVRRCARAKAAVVAADEREGGLRRILNFGHTMGHVVERWHDFTVPHGLAVAAGMDFAVWLSCALGLLGDEEGARLRRLIGEVCGRLPAPPPAQEARSALVVDKKAEGEGIHMVLLTGSGRVKVEKIPVSELLVMYDRYIHELAQDL